MFPFNNIAFQTYEPANHDLAVTAALFKGFQMQIKLLKLKANIFVVVCVLYKKCHQVKILGPNISTVPSDKYVYCDQTLRKDGTQKSYQLSGK